MPRGPRKALPLRERYAWDRVVVLAVIVAAAYYGFFIR
jgi:hypothetical protein